MPQRVSNFTKLLIHADYLVDDWKIKDVCGNMLTNTGVTLSKTQKMFGKKSMYFDGSSYLNVHMSGMIGDLTISGWVRPSATDTYIHIFSIYDNALRVGRGADGRIFIQTPDGAVTYLTGVNFTTSSWDHFALVRASNVYKFYLNGSEYSIKTDSTSLADATLTLGQFGSPTPAYYLTGYMANFCIEIGIARWTSTFTVPSYPPKGRRGAY